LIAKKFPHITKQESGQNIKRLKIFIFPRCIVFTIYQIVKKFDSTITCLEGHRPNQQDAAQNGAGVYFICLRKVFDSGWRVSV